MDRARTLSPRCRFCSEYFGASQSPSPPDVAAGRAAQCEFCSVDRAQSSAREQVVADAPPQQLRRKRDRPSRIDVLIEQDASVDERKPKTSGPMDLDGAAERGGQTGGEVRSSAQREGQLKTVDQWFAFCSPMNPGVKVVKRKGPARRWFGKPRVGNLMQNKAKQCESFALSPNFISHEELMFPWATGFDAKGGCACGESCQSPDAIKCREKESEEQIMYNMAKALQPEGNVRSSGEESSELENYTCSKSSGSAATPPKIRSICEWLRIKNDGAMHQDSKN